MDTTKDRKGITESMAEEIARKILNVETLEVRNRDRLDFHELGVCQIRSALEAAFEAGRKAEAGTATLLRLQRIEAAALDLCATIPDDEALDELRAALAVKEA